MLEQYGHGGDLLTAARTFGRAADQFIDFSSNMNPLGPPEQVKEIIRLALDELVYYPDPASRQLRQVIADTYDVPLESIAVGNGAAELIDLAARVFTMPRAVLAQPGFSEYEEALRKAGRELVPLTLDPNAQFTVQAAQLEQVLHSADGAILGHPNNPTGCLLEADVLQLLADSGKMTILDEAFIDFIPEEEKHSQLRRAASSSKLAVIRSMTKFYSIPGVRLGFIVAHPDHIKRIEALRIPWSVNVFAQRIGEAVLQDEAFKQKTLAWLQQEDPWLAHELTALGFTVFPSAVNYLLVQLPVEWTAQTMQREMGQRGVLIRDASLFPGLDRRYIRVAVKTREQNKQLIETFQQVLR